MRTAIIIPARLGSSRLPNKALLAETGQALICHTAQRAAEIRDLAPGIFSEIVVATDAAEIVAVVEQMAVRSGLSVRAVMTDASHQSGSDRIAEVAATLPGDIDSVLNLQGDEPELDRDSVLRLAEFHQQTRPDISTLVYPVTAAAERANPSLVKAVLGVGGRALYFSRADIPFRRDADSAAVPAYGHVGIYLYQRTALEKFVSLSPGILEQTEKLEQLRALENGMTINALILDQSPAKGIDLREDYDAFVAAWKRSR